MKATISNWKTNVGLLGNAAQWASALASIATLSVAVYGVNRAVPYFENLRLREQKAELEIQIRAAEREKQRTVDELESLRKKTMLVNQTVTNMTACIGMRMALQSSVAQASLDVVAVRSSPQGTLPIFATERGLRELFKVVEDSEWFSAFSDGQKRDLRDAWHEAVEARRPPPQAPKPIPDSAGPNAETIREMNEKMWLLATTWDAMPVVSDFSERCQLLGMQTK